MTLETNKEDGKVAESPLIEALQKQRRGRSRPATLLELEAYSARFETDRLVETIDRVAAFPRPVFHRIEI